MLSEMNLTDQIKRCATVKDAVLLLADEVDILRARLDMLAEMADPWDQPLKWGVEPVDLDAAGELIEEDQQAEIATLRARLATETDPDEAKVLNAKLALALNPGTIPPKAIPEGQRAQVVGDDIVAPPPTEERIEDRRAFANRVQLWTFLKGFDEDAAVDTYAQGGGRWLYYDGGREAIMAMPHWARQAICADIAEDSPKEATEVARDILKAEKGVDMNTAVEFHYQVVDGQ